MTFLADIHAIVSIWSLEPNVSRESRQLFPNPTPSLRFHTSFTHGIGQLKVHRQYAAKPIHRTLGVRCITMYPASFGRLRRICADDVLMSGCPIRNLAQRLAVVKLIHRGAGVYCLRPACTLLRFYGALCARELDIFDLH